ncbi:FAD:protein FMN transferase [Cognatiyoonia sp. IB215446]|uniref:FAD:protein FMN transferase n=1 Tax=Cognatiyoonia sp. IB215446 TaxID=3097355 RepID=UPI002A13000C|nr:FAD:protein FMN transferase [Cognatiyoonia sp. IB215446]MDX8348923.1 FAD:protein FMN transferase [Cognatiyoonia sp. IB215446]
MRMNRRRFLSISAAMLATPAWAGVHSWQGRALGADVSLKIRGARGASVAVLAQMRALLSEVEQLFSLYDPSSAVVRLNNEGVLDNPPERFTALLADADRAHDLTDGLFDPSVQPLWRALAGDGDVAPARSLVGWNRVQWDASRIQLGAGQALTFNGIAQGFATDLVTEHLSASGLTDVLVNIGEYRAIGGTWRLGISDPQHGQLGMRTLRRGAIATSSPSAMALGDEGHILHPKAHPHWSTVSVEADNATLADCLSTALCLAPRQMIEQVRTTPRVKRITLVDFEGNLTSL